MKKSVKGIIGLSAAVVVLGGGLAALKLTESDDNGTETNSSDNTEENEQTEGADIYLMHDESAADEIGSVKEVFVTNQEDKLHVVVGTPATGDSSAVYTLEGYKDVSLDNSGVGALANNAVDLSTKSIIEENCENLSKFGFDEPQATVEVRFETGTVKTFVIGDNAPANSETYVIMDGEDTVYTVSSSSVSNYSKTANDFVSTVILEEPSDDEYPVVESIRIQREDLDYDILLEYDKKSDDSGYSGGTSATHVMVEPTDAYLTVERSTDITNGMFGLDSAGFFSVHCKEADIAEAGLKNPFCTVTMECGDGNTYVLLMSEYFMNDENKKCCYAMLEGGNIIYIVSAENARWGEVLPIDIASRIIIGSYVWNIPELSVKCSNGLSESFTIKQKEGTEENTALRSKDFDVTKNGAVFDSERYRAFYSYLIEAAAEEFALDMEIPDAEPMVTVEFTDSYTNEKFKLDFYENTALTSLIAINGKSKYICAKSYVETLIENVSRLETGEDYITTWK